MIVLVGALRLNCSMAASDVMGAIADETCGCMAINWMHYGYIVLWGEW